MNGSNRLEAVQSKLLDFREKRPVLAEHDQDHFSLFLLLMGEIHELGQEISNNNIEEIEKELADCIIFLLNIAAQYGINVHNAVVTKIDRNIQKYPIEIFNGDTDYHEAIRVSRDSWEIGGGDDKFYNNLSSD